MPEFRGRFLKGVCCVPDEPVDVPDGTCVRIEILPAVITEKSRRKGRKGGIWKGQVAIAPDFDVLPAEVAAAFGVGAP